MGNKKNFTFSLDSDIVKKAQELLEKDNLHIYNSLNHFVSTSMAKEVECYERSKEAILKIRGQKI